MASNTELQHDDSSPAADDVNANHNALVPFEPIFSDSEAPISATPVSFVMPEHASANSASSSSNKRRKRREISELMQFYYHGDKKYRTFKDVKRYIYLGYPPCLENADEPLERLALNQPDPRQEKSP
ncbi:hypothetical protein AG4045_001416 [Apium graveolens]|uniref:Uncharacterized protein n=1 Tax=Apium graveolens TaxID=4045 RepID=A0A6L5BBU6_APIGR|nr:hypothetical protein AG4045_001416 [Apium graveolens]